MGRPGAPRRHTKEEILDIAESIIYESGPAGFSVRSLAKRVGLSPMGLYTYFPSRESILEAVLDRFAKSLDIAPIAGERWDDTIRRITGILLQILHEHPQTMRINYDLRDSWARTQYRSVYIIHKDQGMPDDAYVQLYCGFSSLIAGFVNGCMQSTDLLAKAAESGRELDPWERMIVEPFTDEAFARAVEYIIDAIRKIFEDDPCTWTTPTDPSQWSWTPPSDNALQ